MPDLSWAKDLYWLVGIVGWLVGIVWLIKHW